MKNILITGASGFIGSFLLEEALNRNWAVWAGIRKTSSREYLQDPRIQFIDLNFADKGNLCQQISEHVSAHGKWDYIIHNAGVTKCLNFNDFDRVNYQFTRNFVEALTETGNIPDKFILMSSLSAFPNPETAYGRSKRKAEKFLQAQTTLPYIILRPTGVYGPREKDYYLMMKSIQSGFDARVGFKPQYLSFIYVEDLVGAAYLALESSLSNCIYNVSDGRVYKSQEFSKIVKKVLGKKKVLKITIPLSVVKVISIAAELISKITKKSSTLNRDKYRIMKQRDWTCDIQPIMHDLKFEAKYNLEKGIKVTIQWYKENRWL